MQSIFEYFDALLIGLTATPRDDIDKNTYEIFDLESGVPTYNYELSKAVEDKFLVDYNVVDCKLKFLQAGIKYNDLPEEEKDEYEKTFVDEDGELIDNISSDALNSWVFNEDTIKKVLNTLLMMGLRVNYGNDIGKTIIFAKSHRHAEKILEIWNKEFPSYPDGYCTVIDNYTNYAQSVIDSFSDKKKLPQIAISVDMLDTGIDVPEILNLVFFKSVFSKRADEFNMPVAVVLKNAHITDILGRLTIAGLMFFAKEPQLFRPQFCIKAVWFAGNHIGGTQYHDSRDITGTIPEMYEDAMRWLKSCLNRPQNGQSFNSEGILEIPEIVLEELIQNALVHLDLLKPAAIRLLVFDNRIEIVNPGCLPDGQTIEEVMMGNSDPRNPQLAQFCSKTMPYRGLGSGIPRVMSENCDVELIDRPDGTEANSLLNI